MSRKKNNFKFIPITPDPNHHGVPWHHKCCWCQQCKSQRAAERELGCLKQPRTTFTTNYQPICGPEDYWIVHS